MIHLHQKAPAIPDEKPEYFYRLFGRFCRLLCPIVGIDNHGKEIPVTAATMVRVIGGDYLPDVPDPGEEDFRLTVVMCLSTGREDPRDITHNGVAETMLELEPSMPHWSREDSRAALQQGWDIFERDSPNNDGETFEINSWEHRRFKNDGEAHAFVWCWAVLEDSALHRRALAFIRAVSPFEYRRIRMLGRKAIRDGQTHTP